MNVWMYAIREFEDAIDDCTSCTSDCNEHSTNSARCTRGTRAWPSTRARSRARPTAAAPRARWSTGWRRSGARTSARAARRHATTGTSQVNSELFKAGGLFATGRDLLQQGQCAAVRPLVDQIVSLMTVPLVQGALRYAYKNSEPGETWRRRRTRRRARRSPRPCCRSCTTATRVGRRRQRQPEVRPASRRRHAVMPRATPDFAEVKEAFERRVRVPRHHVRAGGRRSATRRRCLDGGGRARSHRRRSPATSRART